MDKNKIALSSLAMDLKRVALGYHRGSIQMADRFLEEALKRKQEINLKNVKPYVKKLLEKIDGLKIGTDKQKIAEDALMYSALIQNAALASSF